MEDLVTAELMQKYDQYTIDVIGIPGLVLMERAAMAVCEHMHCMNEKLITKSVLIVAGTGNNGTDGLAIARILHTEGCNVTVWIVGNEEKATEQWKCQKHIIDNVGVKVSDNPPADSFDYVVDAIFGVGLKRDITGEFEKAVTYINSLSGIKIAVDIPSGVDSSNGRILGCAVKADVTVTFQCRKAGTVLYPGATCCGEVIKKDVGICIPKDGKSNAELVTFTQEPSQLLPKRFPAGNKGTFGKALIVAGSESMAGAACLCAEACYRTGTGMVKVISPPVNRNIVLGRLPECLYGTLETIENDLKWADVVIAGPGIGVDEYACKTLETLISQCDKPLVLDADALNILSGEKELREKLIHRNRNGKECILTPHVGELQRLLSAQGRSELTIEEIKEELREFAQFIAESYYCTVVAKDARTFVCRKGQKSFVSLRGNDGMAVAGSGDVLSGIIGSLKGRKMDDYQAACVGVLLHGRAGEIAATKSGRNGMLAGDMVAALGLYFAQCHL